MSAVKVAQSFIDQWIAVFNARDTDARLQLLHFPHLRVMPSGQIRIEDEFMAKRLFLIGHQMQVDERWDHSVIDQVQVIHHSADKIHVTNRFTRYHADGTKYLIGHTLWILIKVDGQWKRCCVSNIDIQRSDVSAEELQRELAKREQLLQRLTIHHILSDIFRRRFRTTGTNLLIPSSVSSLNLTSSIPEK